MATLQTANANIYTWHGHIPRRTGLTGLGGRALYQCRDGKWLSFTVPIGVPLLWDAFVEWLQDEGIDTPITGEEWRDPAYRFQHPGVTTEAIAELTKRHDRGELFHEGQRRRMLVLPVNNVKDLLEDEQLRARDYFVAVEHPELHSTLRYPGAPYHFSETPAHGDRRAPLLGEHNEEVYGDLLGMSASERKQLEAEGVA